MKNETVTFFGKKYRVSTLSVYSARRPIRLYSFFSGRTCQAYSTQLPMLNAKGNSPQQAVDKLEVKVLKGFRNLAKACGYEVSE